MAGKGGVQKRHGNQEKLGVNKPQEVEIAKETPKRRNVLSKVFETRRTSRIKRRKRRENQGKRRMEAGKIL